MKTNPIKYTPALLLAMFAVSTGANAGITGTNAAAAADYQQYNQVGATLVPDNSVSLSSILAGNAAAPGGNVELFKSSETASGNAAFASGQTTSLVGTLGGSTLTLSSLNANDWNANVGGGQTLLQKWVSDLIGSQPLLPNTPASQAAIIAQFVSNGGEQRFSDPNISYAYSQSGAIHIGLAGILDAKPLLQSIVGPAFAPYLAMLSSVQISELVKVNYNGVTSYLYGFNATASGLATTDGTNSYNAIYDVTLADAINSGNQLVRLNVEIPEPSVIFLLGLGLVGFTLAKKKQA